jgi:hypothetical protein
VQKNMQSFLLLSGLALTLSLGACSSSSGARSSQPAAAPPLNLPPPGPYGVTVESKWAYSAYENRPAAQWLLQHVRDSAGEGTAGIDKLVKRWPDLSLDILRDGAVGDADFPLFLSIADSYDRVFGVGDPAAGWSNALAVSVSQADAYSAYRTKRQHLLELFKSGDLIDAAAIDLPAALPGNCPPALRTEALRLAGLTVLLNDRPDKAAEFFSQASDAARLGPSHVRFEIGLLWSESLRRSGRLSDAASVWQNVVTLAADIRDPDLWERAILIKPANIPWPPQAAIDGADEPDFSQGLGPDTADVLIGIGKMRLARGANQAALLNFSRAETETNIPGKKSLARIYRVQSMIQLQLVASALPMLDGLTKSPDPRIARRAEALEGDVQCRILGDRKHGIPLLSMGLNDPDAGEWPGKDQLCANLALYYLLDGEDEKGVQLLHLVESQFEAGAQWENLARALQDEAAYLRVTGKDDQADVIQKRADEICRKAGLSTGPLTEQSATD